MFFLLMQPACVLPLKPMSPGGVVQLLFIKDSHNIYSSPAVLQLLSLRKSGSDMYILAELCPAA